MPTTAGRFPKKGRTGRRPTLQRPQEWGSVMRALQGNFDAVRGGLSALVDGHNSLVDDVAKLARRVNVEESAAAIVPVIGAWAPFMFQPNTYLAPQFILGGNILTTSAASGAMRLSPVYLPGTSYTIAKTGFIAGTGTTKPLRIGIYAADAVDAGDGGTFPGSLVADLGTVTPNGIGFWEATGLSVTIPGGTYWLGYNPQTTGVIGAGAYFGVNPNAMVEGYRGTTANPPTVASEGSARTTLFYNSGAVPDGALPNPAPTTNFSWGHGLIRLYLNFSAIVP